MTLPTRIPLVMLPLITLMVGCTEPDPECQGVNENASICVNDNLGGVCEDGQLVDTFTCPDCTESRAERQCIDGQLGFYQVQVEATDPAPGATNVAIDVIPAIELDVPIYQPSDATEPAVTLTVDGQLVPGEAGFADVGLGSSSTVWGYVPAAPLDPNTEYRVELSDQMKVDPDTLAELGYADGGFATGSEWWVFTTADDATPTVPTLVDTEPEFNSTMASPFQAISATFSRDIASSSLNESTMYVEGPDGFVLSGALSVDGDTVIFTPDSQLNTSSTYDVTITTGLTDTEGNAIDSAVEWSFTTVGFLQVTGMTPSTGSTGVLIDTEVALTFNVPLDPNFVDNDTVQPRANRTVEEMDNRIIDVNVVVDGNTLRFSPTVGDWQEYETGYTVRLDRDLRGINGEPLNYGNDYIFTTIYFDPNRSYTVHTVASGRSTSMDLNSSDEAIFTSDVGGSVDSRWYFEGYQGNWLIKSEGTGDGEALAVRVDGSPQQMVSVPSSNIDQRQQWFIDREGGQPGFTQQRGESPGVVYLKTPWFGNSFVLTAGSGGVSLDPPTRRTNQLFWFKRRL